jgi:sporulation protein YlmC with PRC-barrel domain
MATGRNVLRAATVAVFISAGSVAWAVVEPQQPTTHGVTKASSWIGMDVEDKAGNNVGEIKDLVVDWQTGKVSYAIVAIEKWLHIDSKLVAIEPNRLEVTPDGKHVIVAMTEAEVQALPGFDEHAPPRAPSESSAQKTPRPAADAPDTGSDDSKRTY